MRFRAKKNEERFDVALSVLKRIYLNYAFDEMIAKVVWGCDRKLSADSYEVQRKLIMPDKIKPVHVLPTRIQEEPEKFDLIRKIEADKAELEAQLEAANLA